MKSISGFTNNHHHWSIKFNIVSHFRENCWKWLRGIGELKMIYCVWYYTTLNKKYLKMQSSHINMLIVGFTNILNELQNADIAFSLRCRGCECSFAKTYFSFFNRNTLIHWRLNDAADINIIKWLRICRMFQSFSWTWK